MATMKAAARKRTTSTRAPKLPRIKSTFAILDVKAGRKQLAEHFKDAPRLGPTPRRFLIPVTITGYLEGTWSHDDGVSQEFSIDVKGVKVGK